MDIGCGTKKRERSANFIEAEVQLLTAVTKKFRSIIDNKKTDAVTNKQKEAAWVKIADVFNSASGFTERNVKTLKLKYEGLKKGTKKKASQQCQELNGTAGGTSAATSHSDLSICSNSTGWETRNDSDVVTAQLSHPEVQIVEMGAMKEEVAELTVKVEVYDETEEEPGEQTDAEPEEDMKEAWSKAEENMATEKDAVIIGDDLKKWQHSTPHPHKPIAVPFSKNKRTPKERFTNKIDGLSAARLELVELQKHVARKELEFKQIEHKLHVHQRNEEHEIRMLHLHNEERRRDEEHKLKVKKFFLV